MPDGCASDFSYRFSPSDAWRCALMQDYHPAYIGPVCHHRPNTGPEGQNDDQSFDRHLHWVLRPCSSGAVIELVCKAAASR